MNRHRATELKDRGDTLVELLVTVVILGIAIVGIMGALGNITLASDLHRRAADGDTVLRTFSSHVLSRPYVTTCNLTPPFAYAAGFTPAAQTSNYVTAITSVSYWTGATPINASTSFAASCPSTGDKGLQLVTVTVTSPGGRDIESATLLKRRS